MQPSPWIAQRTRSPLISVETLPPAASTMDGTPVTNVFPCVEPAHIRHFRSGSFPSSPKDDASGTIVSGQGSGTNFENPAPGAAVRQPRERP